MIVSVVSPVHGQAGNTTVALLISLLLAKTQNKTVCLTHLSAQSSAFYAYLGLDALEDKTCTPSQVVKLLREGAIDASEMIDYCIRVCDGLDIFSNNSKSFSAEDMELTQRFILESMPHDFIIVDIDINTNSPIAKLALEKSGLTIVALTQSGNVLERYNEILKGVLANKTLFLCNQYAPAVGSIKTFAKFLGVKQQNCATLHHSNTLMKLSNDGRLDEFIRMTKELPIPELETDLKQLAAGIMQNFKLRSVWK